MKTTFKNPVKVAAIKITSTTREYTGLETYEEVAEESASLFKKLNGTDLKNLVIQKIYKGKLNEEQEKEIDGMSKEELRTHAIENLTFQLEVAQNYDRPDNSESKLISVFMGTRLNISESSNGIKKDWITTTFGNIQAQGIKLRTDLTQLYLEQGLLLYVMRRFTFDPEFREGRIISSPYRAGKGGDILTKDDKLIFMKTECMFVNVDGEEEAVEAYSAFEALEQLNRDEFKRPEDSTKERIAFMSVPSETKDKNGYFNPEFEDWISEKYAETTQNIHTVIA